MEKRIKSIYGGVNSKVADLLVNRLIPGHETIAVGPVVFLDHIYPKELREMAGTIPTGEFAHPHRGIATFSYVLSGGLSHYDSKGNHETITAGGVQWMKAGNGILHDELPFAVGKESLFHSLQFWINLPSQYKTEEPTYRAVQASEVPEVKLPQNAGVLRVLLGEFGSVASPVSTFSKEFIYHIKLNPKSVFSLLVRNELEYAAFMPERDVIVNDTFIGNSKIVIFEQEGDEIGFENPHINPADILVFGGLHYNEPIVAEGPFVMNDRSGIAMAYRDFFDGKYGVIYYK